MHPKADVAAAAAAVVDEEKNLALLETDADDHTARVAVAVGTAASVVDAFVCVVSAAAVTWRTHEA